MPDLEFRFPEAFLEVGKDEDYSYKSLRTTRLSDGRLKIDAEGWGVWDLCLAVETGMVIKLNFFGFCGSQSGNTLIKLSGSRILEKEEEEKAKEIKYRGHTPGEIKLSKLTYQNYIPYYM